MEKDKLTEVTEVKINKKLKEACDDLFHHLGLDTETAINIFLAASLRDMGIPFHVGFDDDFADFDDCCGHCGCGCDCDDCDCDDCDCDDCCCDDKCGCKHEKHEEK